MIAMITHNEDEDMVRAVAAAADTYRERFGISANRCAVPMSAKIHGVTVNGVLVERDPTVTEGNMIIFRGRTRPKVPNK